MRYFTRFLTLVLLSWGVLALTEAQAQVAVRYYAGPYGKDNVDETQYETVCQNPADPCSLQTVFNVVEEMDIVLGGVVGGSGYVEIAVLLGTAGGSVEIAAGNLLEISHLVNNIPYELVGYLNNGSPTQNVAGTIRITGEELRIGLDGVSGSSLTVGENLTVVVLTKKVNIGGTQIDDFLDNGHRNISGSVVFGGPGYRVDIVQESSQPIVFKCPAFEDLVVAGSVRIDLADCDGRANLSHSMYVANNVDVRGGTLKLYPSDPVMELYSERPAGTDPTPGFVQIADGASIEGGTLRLQLANYVEPNWRFANDRDPTRRYLPQLRDNPCFELRGGGRLEMDIESPPFTEYGQQGYPNHVNNNDRDKHKFVCVKGGLAFAGRGGTSTLHGGTMLFTDGKVMHDGDLIFKDGARAVFEDGLDVTGDLQMLSTEEGARITNDIDFAYVTDEHYSMNAHDPEIILRKHFSGVYLRASSSIRGNVTVAIEITPRGLIIGYGNPSTRNASAIYFEGSGSSTVEGTLSLGAGKVFLGASSLGAHNLTLMGDVEVNVSSAPAIPRTFGAYLFNADAWATTAQTDACSDGSGMVQSASNTNKVIFAGGLDQKVNVVGGEALEIGAISIDKSADMVRFSETSDGVTTSYVEVQQGAFVTGSTEALLGFGAGGTLVMNTDGGLMTDAASMYVSPPENVIYGGSATMAGMELESSVMNLTIHTSGRITMEADKEVTVLGDLHLMAGTLVPGKMAIAAGSQSVYVGSTGNIELASGRAFWMADGVDVVYQGGTTRTPGAHLWPSGRMADDYKYNVVLDQKCRTELKLALDGDAALGGNLTLTKGVLDLNGNDLILQDYVNGDQMLEVESGGKLCDSMNGVPCDAMGMEAEVGAAMPETGIIIQGRTRGITGIGSTKIMARAIPSVRAEAPSDLELMASGNPRDMNVLWLPHLQIDGMNVTVGADVDKLHIHGDLKVMGGSLTQMDPSDHPDDDLTATPPVMGRQLVAVLDDYMQTGGSVDVMLQAITVMGDFMQAEYNDAGEPEGTRAMFDVGGGMHKVMGDFVVAMDEGAGKRNRYMLGGGMLEVIGDFHFEGSGDVITGADEMQGLAGKVFFNAPTNMKQMVYQIADYPAACLPDVEVMSGGLMGMSDIWQRGELTLRNGVIDMGEYSWNMVETEQESPLSNRLWIPIQDPTNREAGLTASIYGGSRYSFVTRVGRSVQAGNAGTGSMYGGYLFPTGIMAAEVGGRTRFNPFILQFISDLYPVGEVNVTAYEDMTMQEWPMEGITVPGGAGGDLLLDTYASTFWKVEMDMIPAQDPNVRLAADRLVGANDVTRLRIVQWDCDGMNPRLAGSYEPNEDREVFAGNHRINGLPTLTQEGVLLGMCSIFGIAANHLENPIGVAPPPPAPTATFQLIHNVEGATVDVYIGDVRVADDFAFQTATALAHTVAAGQHMLHIVPAAAPDASRPLASIPVEFMEDEKYTIIASGNLLQQSVGVVAKARSSAAADAMVEFRIVHGAAGLGDVDIRPLGPADNMPIGTLWANNMSFGDVSGYKAVDPGVHHVELTTASQDRQIDVFYLDLGDYIDEALVLALSGSGRSSQEGLTIMAVAADGEVFFPDVITSTSSGAVPAEFALQGNYPNPFNPSTRIAFDLPEASEVTLEVIDLLGRTVLVVPEQQVEAGTKRSIELHAASLASGTYLYRLIARSVSGVEIATGRMVLVK